MSDTNARHEPPVQTSSSGQHQAQAPAQPQAQPQAQQPAAPTKPAKPAKRGKVHDGPRLSTFLKVSIALLAGLTIASISLLFIGDFEGKFERVFSTFALFAVFVLFTALDTRRGQKSEWYAPVALIANAYILGLLLIVIWMTPYASFGLMFEIFWKSVFVILVTRLVIVCCQLLLKTGDRLPAVVTRFAFITSVLAVLAGILFTAPVGIEAFDLVIPDIYWKIATALLILTALGLSITLLLRWSYGAQDRDAARAARAQQAQQPYPTQQPYVTPQPYRAQQGYGQQGYPQQGYPASQSASQPASQSGAPLLPWPTFADGRPLPARADGQPDFTVPGAPRP
ncbi:hypothetical protein ACXR2T_05395 [Leucobacter sp. HY1910]